MSDYTPTFTNAVGQSKDANNATASAAEVGTEFDAIQTATNSKLDDIGGGTTGNVVTVGSSGSSLLDGGQPLPSGTLVGTTDTQTLTNKTIDSGTITGTITGDHTYSGNVTFSNNINGDCTGVVAGGVQQDDLEQPSSGTVDVMCFHSSAGHTVAYSTAYIGRESANKDLGAGLGPLIALKSGVVDISIEMQKNSGGTAYMAIDKFSPNGTRTELIEHSTTSATYVTKTYTATLSAGDVLAFSFKATSPNVSTRNFKIKANKQMFIFG
jgi:hypothetical protein